MSMADLSKVFHSLDLRVETAVRHFWSTRKRQARRQGSASGQKDQGARSAVTGGAQMDGFMNLLTEVLLASGMKTNDIFFENRWNSLVSSGRRRNGTFWL
jgi:hypothetical protein